MRTEEEIRKCFENLKKDPGAYTFATSTACMSVSALSWVLQTGDEMDGFTDEFLKDLNKRHEQPKS